MTTPSSSTAASVEPRPASKKNLKIKGRAACTQAKKGEGISKIYSHWRALGLVTDAVPFAIQSRGGVYFVTASIGRAFHIYNVDSLGLLFVGSELPARIVALASHEDFTFAACENGTVYCFERAQRISSYSFEATKDPRDNLVLRMEILGDSLLVVRPRSLTVLPLDLNKSRRAFMEFSDGQATCLLHPHTYLNKVVLGFDDGHLELWNFRTSTRIHRFSSVAMGRAVSCLAQAPVVDIVAVGFMDGSVRLMDLRADQVLFTLNASAAVTALTFNSSPSMPHVAVGCGDGRLSIWNLESHCLEFVTAAHARGPVQSASFLPGQPIIVTAGGDNSLKVWTLEAGDVRLVKSRSGHIASPTKVTFYDEDGFSLLSAGGREDQSIRYTSLLNDAQSHELSQGSIESKARRLQTDAVSLKLPPSIGYAFFNTKDLQWDNLATIHAGSAVARTWRPSHKAIGKHALKSSDGSPWTAVAMSACGNFVLLASSKGTVDVFNVQSGLLRKTIKAFNDASGSTRVIGVAVDECNREGVIVAADGRLALFDWNRPQKVQIFEVGGVAVSFEANPSNGLVAIGLSDGTVKVFDVVGRRVVRSLPHGASPIIDLTFSPDSQWLLAVTGDGTLLTWDLPSAMLIDSMPSVSLGPVTSASFSPTGDFVATTHGNGDLAIHLWSTQPNSSVSDHIDYHKKYDLPEVSGTLLRLDAELIRLSSQPRSKWSQLLHLDSVKERNRVVQPQVAPLKAPFFLDAAIAKKRDIEGESAIAIPITTTHNIAATSNNTSMTEDSLGAVPSTAMSSLLDNDKALLEFILTSKIAVISFEIQTLPQDSLEAFLGFLLAQLLSKQNFELIQTVLNLTLTAHQDELGGQHHREILGRLEEAQRDLWEDNLEGLLQKSLCLTSFCKDRF